MRIARTITRILLLGWVATWLAPLALFAVGGGFCADCHCCDELFGGRVACVRGLDIPDRLEMDCDDEVDPQPVVPPLLGKVRPGVLAAEAVNELPIPLAHVESFSASRLVPFLDPPETPPPRS